MKKAAVAAEAAEAAAVEVVEVVVEVEVVTADSPRDTHFTARKVGWTPASHILTRRLNGISVFSPKTTGRRRNITARFASVIYITRKAINTIRLNITLKRWNMMKNVSKVSRP